MTAPDLVLTTLGAANSGRSIFLLGMYDILSTGLHGYFVFIEDPDQGADLRDTWDDLLCDEGRAAPTQYRRRCQLAYFRFVFNQGFTPLITVDWFDYPGGGAGRRPDLRRGRRRAVADPLARVGQHLPGAQRGQVSPNGWTARSARPVVQSTLRVRELSTEVQQAVPTRAPGRWLPLPSRAVLITKSDLLRGALT